MRSPSGSATLETGFSCTPLDPTLVNASGLALRGIQFKYQTPYSMGGNFTVQYQLTPSMSVQAGYVTSLARHLECSPTPTTSLRSYRRHSPATTTASQGFRRSPILVRRQLRHYQRQQLVPLAADQSGKAIRQRPELPGDLHILQDETDAGDCLTGEVCKVSALLMSLAPGFTMTTAWLLLIFATSSTLAAATNFPSAKTKRFMSMAGGVTNALAGGWSRNWSADLQGGQPITLTCPSGTANGTGCYTFG